MTAPRLQTRFLMAASFFVVATLASGVWSAYTFTRLSRVIGATLSESQQRIHLTTTLASALEREDSALLSAVNGGTVRAIDDLRSQRGVFNAAYTRLSRLLSDIEERDVMASLRQNADAYRVAANSLLTSIPLRNGRTEYDEKVNPLLRKAVSDTAHLRDLTFRAMQTAGRSSRDQATHATAIVMGVSLVALLISTAVALHLDRTVVDPIRELTDSVEALRGGDFERRVTATSRDELGLLADGFNRMATTLAEFRRSNLGEVVRAKETLESTLAALPDGVIVLGPDGHIATVNPLARSILHAIGVEPTSTLDDLPFPVEHLLAVRETLAGLHPLGRRSQSDRTLSVRLDDRECRFAAVVRPIQDFAYGRLGAVLALTDVTDFVRLDELRTELIALVSHELKTPLTTLRMNLLLLGERSDDLSARQREILSTAILGCEELAATIDELLDLSRIEAGQLRLALSRVDVLDLVEHAVRTFRARYDAAGLDLSVVCDCPEAVVLGDAPRLALVLANLLSNSLRYTPPGGRVVVNLSSRRNAGSRAAWLLRIAVTDTGPGIPEEFRQRVFEKFFRIDDHNGRRGTAVQGTGFGLYLCRQIIEAHGGVIGCEPGDANRGTRVFLELNPAPPAV